MISVDELKEALRVRNDVEDTYIKTLEAAAVAVIERETGRYYGEEKTVTEIIGASRVLWLLSEPNEITAIDANEGDDWQPVTGYEASGRRLVFTDTWRYPTDLRIEYTTGYDPEDVPADAKLRVIQLVTLWYERRLPEADVFAMQQATLGFVPVI